MCEMSKQQLKKTILEIVDNQLKSNDPPAAKSAYTRLLDFGYTSIEAKEKIFQYYKNKYMDYYKKYTNNEVLYITQEAKFWHENGYFEYDSFSELFKSKHTLK